MIKRILKWLFKRKRISRFADVERILDEHRNYLNQLHKKINSMEKRIFGDEDLMKLLEEEKEFEYGPLGSEC